MSYLGNANDGVSSDYVFMKTKQVEFLKEESLFTYHTDPNHSVKNRRYQLVVGGNSVKTIGDSVIDTGLLVEAKVPQELFFFFNFASDLLV